MLNSFRWLSIKDRQESSNEFSNRLQFFGNILKWKNRQWQEVEKTKIFFLQIKTYKMRLENRTTIIKDEVNKSMLFIVVMNFAFDWILLVVEDLDIERLMVLVVEPLANVPSDSVWFFDHHHRSIFLLFLFWAAFVQIELTWDDNDLHWMVVDRLDSRSDKVGGDVWKSRTRIV